MKITQRQLRQIIHEELVREMGMHRRGSPSMRGHGPGDSFLDHPPEAIPDMGDQYDPDYRENLDDEDEEGDYPYGEDPDEFLDLPAGEIQNRLRDRY